MNSANIVHYIEWLEGYLSKGKNPTHLYDYPMRNVLDRWFIATRDFRTGGECGSSAACIIIPEGISHIGGDIGHNNLYLMKTFGVIGHWVPIYSDIEFQGLGLDEWKRELIERDERFMCEARRWKQEQLDKMRYSDIPRRG